jgi:carbamoyl-phosphate synthase small subunit
LVKERYDLQATLLLEDGTRLQGAAAGAPGVTVGELSVYNGHDAVHRLTDPAAAGQICAFTQPSVGTWGVNTEHCETGVPWLRGLIAREITTIPSNWRSAETLDFFLRRSFITAISGIDTLELARYAAEKQIKRCAIVASADFNGWDALLDQVRAYRYNDTFPAAVKAPVSHGSGKSAAAHVAVCDFGSSHGLTRLLNAMRVRVTLLPPYDAPTIFMRDKYDALILPDGAGSPRSHPGITEGLRGLIAEGVPMLGFGLGFRFITLAAGAKLRPMREPHRGAWLPVTDLQTDSVLYTWQSHGQTPEEPLPQGLTVTHRNAADDTVEGFVLEGKPVAAVHFLPCPDMRLGGTGEIFNMLFNLLRQGGASYAG